MFKNQNVPDLIFLGAISVSLTILQIVVEYNYCLLMSSFYHQPWIAETNAEEQGLSLIFHLTNIHLVLFVLWEKGRKATNRLVVMLSPVTPSVKCTRCTSWFMHWNYRPEQPHPACINVHYCQALVPCFVFLFCFVFSWVSVFRICVYILPWILLLAVRLNHLPALWILNIWFVSDVPVCLKSELCLFLSGLCLKCEIYLINSSAFTIASYLHMHPAT